jgi:hypothetical protein
MKVVPVFQEIRSNKLAWYGHVMRRDESYIPKRMMSMNVDEHPSRCRPRKRWMDCVKDAIKGVSLAMTRDRREWKKKTCCADPT